MYEDLPGGDILEQGLEALRKGIVNENSLLLAIGARRLGEVGIRIPTLDLGEAFPEDKLFELLSRAHGDQAYRLYNSLVRRLVSLEHALESLPRWQAGLAGV